MTSIQFTEIEQFFLSQKQEEFVELLPKGTPKYDFFSMILIQKKKGILGTDLNEKLDKYIDNDSKKKQEQDCRVLDRDTQNYFQKLKIQQLIQQTIVEKDEKVLKQIFKKWEKIFKVDFVSLHQKIEKKNKNEQLLKKNSCEQDTQNQIEIVKRELKQEDYSIESVLKRIKEKQNVLLTISKNFINRVPQEILEQDMDLETIDTWSHNLKNKEFIFHMGDKLPDLIQKICEFLKVQEEKYLDEELGEDNDIDNNSNEDEDDDEEEENRKTDQDESNSKNSQKRNDSSFERQEKIDKKLIEFMEEIIGFESYSLKQANGILERLPFFKKSSQVNFIFLKKFKVQFQDFIENFRKNEISYLKEPQFLVDALNWAENYDQKGVSFILKLFQLYLRLISNKLDSKLFWDLFQVKNIWLLQILGIFGENRFNINQEKHGQFKKFYQEKYVEQYEFLREQLEIDDFLTHIQDNLLKNYFDLVFKEQERKNEFDFKQIRGKYQQIFEIQYIERQFAKFWLQKGKQLNEIKEILNLENGPQKMWFDRYQEKISLKIQSLRNNKFRSDEDIKLKVKVKNIQNLQVNIYVIDSFNYYKTYRKNIDEYNLEIFDLMPNFTYKFEYQLEKYSKVQEHIENFEFQELKKFKSGNFMVQFCAGEIISRAFIVKGGLNYVSRQQLDGYRLQIFDDLGNLCNEKDKTGIYYNERFLYADQNGEILIPFLSQKAQNPEQNVILCHDENYSLATINLESEFYQLNCQYIYNQESFLVGQKSKLIVLPQLTMNKQKSSLQLLENVEIIVTQINQEDIPNIEKFNQLEFDEFKKEQEIEFIIKSYPKSIDIQISGEVKDLNGEIQKLEHQHKILFKSKSSYSLENVEVYLQKSVDENKNDNYFLSVLGLNGEPIKNEIISLKLSANFLDIQEYKLIEEMEIKMEIKQEKKMQLQQKQYSNESLEDDDEKEDISIESDLENQDDELEIEDEKLDFLVQTDKNGQVSLGPLKLINQVSVSLFQDKVKKSWVLEELSNKYSCSEQIGQLKFKEGEDVIIGGGINQNQVENFVLVLQNESLNIDFKKGREIDMVFENGILKLKNLQAGEYSLYLFDDYYRIIYFEVQKNVEQNKNLLSVYEDQVLQHQNKQILEIQDVQISYGKDNLKDTLDMQIQITKNHLNEFEQADLEILRVHIVGYQYIDQNQDKIKENIKQIKKGYNFLPATSEYQEKESTVIINHSKLSDEEAYVMNRQKKKGQKKQMGNELEKPCIFLKKTEVRDCQTEKEQLNDKIKGIKNKKQDKMCKKKSQKKRKKKNQDNESSSLSQSDYDYQEGCNFIGNNKLNFLRNGAFVMANLKVNNNKGKTSIKNIPSYYQSYQVYLVGPEEVLMKSVYQGLGLRLGQGLGQGLGLEMKNISMKSQLEENKFYAQIRECQTVKPQQELVLEQDSQNYILTNYKQLYDLQRDLRQQSKFRNENENFSKFEEWSFIAEWDSYGFEKKLEKYNQFASHELNLFLFFRDSEFFEKVVKIFVKDKIEKEFLDYFILGFKNQILDFARIERFKELNYLEKVLLIKFLYENGENAKADGYSKLIAEQCQNASASYYNSLIDTILLSKQEELESEFEKLEDSCRNSSDREDDDFYSDEDKCENQDKEGFYDDDEEEEDDDILDDLEKECINVKKQAFQISSELSLQNEMLCDLSEEVDEAFDLQSPQKVMQKKQIQKQVQKQLQLDQQQQQQIKQRKKYIKGFENMKKTKEYKERTYYNFVSKNSQVLYNNNKFYSDYCTFLKNRQDNSKFLSQNFIFCTKSVQEMIMVHTLLNLKCEKIKISTKSVGNRQIQYTNCDNEDQILIFYKNIQEKEQNLQSNFLLSQKFYDPKDQFIKNKQNSQIKMLKQVKEFVQGKIYSCQINVSNLSQNNLELQLMYEVPNGAIPIGAVQIYNQTKVLDVKLKSTQQINFSFYFPEAGNFEIYPASISFQDKVLGVAHQGQKMKLKVVENVQLAQKQGKEQNEFEEIKEILLNQIKKNQVILNEDRQKMEEYSLKKEGYDKVVKYLKGLFFFQQDVYKFSIYHNDLETFKEFFIHSMKKNVNELNGLKYLSFKDIKQDDFIAFEYHPLLSNRIHNFQNQEKSKILNKQFKEKYQEFLNYLIQINDSLQAKHYLTFAYYLLLQEKVQEALIVVEKIESDQIGEHQLQYDYLIAYLDIYNGYPNFYKAREISQKYLDYPILSWRKLYISIDEQLSEYDEGQKLEKNLQEKMKKKEEENPENKKEIGKNLESAEKEEQILPTLEKDFIQIGYCNLSSIQIRYFVLNLEQLFSKNPFIDMSKFEFEYVQANHQQLIVVQKQAQIKYEQVKIPENLLKQNMVIQLVAKNEPVNILYNSSFMKIQVLEKYGQVKVTDNEYKPIDTVYIKCYYKNKNDEVVFFRDGYTDLRGKFDYAQSSSIDINSIKEFALYFNHEKFGAAIKKVKPPVQSARY